MIVWLSSSTIGRLRDQLREHGARPSLALNPQATPDDAEYAAMKVEFGPLCEAMYLMMSADGSVGGEEREVLRGALRNLSDGRVRTAHIERMLEESARRASTEGRPQRMADLIATLKDDPARSEVAFVLAAAIAFADDQIADAENETLNDLAEGLGINEERANELLDEVETDLEAGGGAAS